MADEGLTVDHAGLSWDAVVTNLGSAAGEVVFLTTSLETGCVEQHEFILPEPPELGIYLEYSPALCHDDVAQVLASGYGGTPGYLVNWSGVDPSNLPPGESEFTLTDGNGCTLDSSLQVVIPDPLTIEVQVINEDAGEDGSLSLSIEGGTPPYNVLWNDGTQGDTILTNLGKGCTAGGGRRQRLSPAWFAGHHQRGHPSGLIPAEMVLGHDRNGMGTVRRTGRWRPD